VRELDVAEPFLEHGESLRVLRINGYELASASLNGCGYPQDVVMVEADDSEFDGILRLRFRVHTWARYLVIYRRLSCGKAQK
jgi:hypothetical protein